MFVCFIGDLCLDGFKGVSLSDNETTCLWLSTHQASKADADDYCLQKTNNKGHLAVVLSHEKQEAILSNLFEGR